MKTILIALFFSFFSTAAFCYVDVDIDSDCVNGHISTDLHITVNGESFSYNPSCRFSFDHTFTTSTGESCSIRSGMCSRFSPSERVEVSCDQSGSDSANIPCPDRN